MGIFNEKQSKQNIITGNHEDDKKVFHKKVDHSISTITKLESKMKKMDEKLTAISQLLSSHQQKGNEITSSKDTKMIMSGNGMTMNDNECINKLKLWLSKDVGLPNYYDLLIENGFDSLEMI